MHVCVPEYIYKHHMCSGAHGDQKVALGLLELQAIVSCHVSAENWT